MPATLASPVSALFEPSAVLSSRKALFPLRVKSPARLVICPPVNSIALSPAAVKQRRSGHPLCRSPQCRSRRGAPGLSGSSPD